METVRLTEPQTEMYNCTVRPVVDSVVTTSWRQQDSYTYATQQLKLSKKPHRFTKDLSLIAYWPNATEQLKLHKKPLRFTKDLSLTVYILTTCYSAAKARRRATDVYSCVERPAVE